MKTKCFFYLVIFSMNILLITFCSSPNKEISPDESTKKLYSELNTYYKNREGEKYLKLLKNVIQEAHRLKPEYCVYRQKILIEVGKKRGFDGLESLWLIYQDGAAAENNNETHIQSRLDNAKALKSHLNFQKKVAYHVPQFVSRWNSIIIRTIRSEALRSILETFVTLDITEASKFDYHQILNSPKVFKNFCGLELRKNQDNLIANVELIRWGHCLSEGKLTTEEMCDFFKQLNSNRQSLEGNPMAEQVFNQMGNSDINRLANLCGSITGNSISGGGSGNGLGGGGLGGVPGGGSMDNMDNFSISQCIQSKGFWKESLEHFQLMQECFSLNVSNPIAEGGFNPDLYNTVQKSGGEEGPWDVGVVDGPVIQTSTRTDVLETMKEHGQIIKSTGGSLEDAEKDFEKKLDNAGIEKVEDGTIKMKDGTEKTVFHDDAGNVTMVLIEYPDGAYARRDYNTNEDGELGDPGYTDVYYNSDKIKVKEVTVKYDKETDTHTKTTWTFDPKTKETHTKTVTKNGKPPSQGAEWGPAYDPTNPACAKLMEEGLLESQKFWDNLFGRNDEASGPYVDPNTIYPNPEEESPGEVNLPFCNPMRMGVGRTQNTACSNLIICEFGILDENCRCSGNNQSLSSGACFAIRCPDGSMAKPVGGNYCICEGGEEEEGEPGQGIDPPVLDIDVKDAFTKFGLIGIFNEQLWSREDGMIILMKKNQLENNFEINRIDLNNFQTPVELNRGNLD